VLVADEFLARVDDAGGVAERHKNWNSADYADGCHEQHVTASAVPSLSSSLSPRFLPPSRRVRQRWGSGKGSGRTFGGVEIEVELLVGRETRWRRVASKRQVEQGWLQSCIE
jgi:hypothetical protein